MSRPPPTTCPDLKPTTMPKPQLKPIALVRPPEDAPMHFAPQAIEHPPRRLPLPRGEKAAIALFLLVLLALLVLCIAAIEGHAPIRGL